jgi:small neutral amino acid transporter SnatA (MarC family)
MELIVAATFTVIGVAIKYGKMYFLIAGYNTMSLEEKQKVDIARVATLFRNVMFTMAFVLVVGSLILPRFGIPMLMPAVTAVTTLTGVSIIVVKSNSAGYKVKK